QLSLLHGPASRRLVSGDRGGARRQPLRAVRSRRRGRRLRRQPDELRAARPPQATLRAGLLLRLRSPLAGPLRRPPAAAAEQQATAPPPDRLGPRGAGDPP